MVTTAEREIRKEFAEWYGDSATRDLNAVMTKIDDGVVSYEHQAPLQYIGAAAVRESCRQGFDTMKGDLSWDVPDLQVIVRGEWPDIAKVPVTEALVSRAETLAWDFALRGYDAVQLASALTWQEAVGAAVTLATFDRQLWDSGKKAGVRIWPRG